MKNYSRVLRERSLENNDYVKLASEASQENFGKKCVLITKYEQTVKSEHLLFPKIGGGVQTHMCPNFLKLGASAPLPPPPLSYAGESDMMSQLD